MRIILKANDTGEIVEGTLFASDENLWYVGTDAGDFGFSKHRYSRHMEDESLPSPQEAICVPRSSRLCIPGPFVSKNRMYVVVKSNSGKLPYKRVVSSEYRKFRKRVVPLMQAQIAYTIDKPVSIDFILFATKFYKNGNRRKYDAANIIDTLLDTMVLAGIISDDNLVERLALEFLDKGAHEDNRVEILVKEFRA